MIVITLFVNGIGGVIASDLTLNSVDRGFKPLSGKTKDYKFGICVFFANHAALRSNSKV